jgi:2-C-methyl-D-erythritol 4-phosphate cytidylyltransferase
MATAIVAAAGAGERLGGEAPKALVEVAGRPLAAWCLGALAAAESVERAVVAAPHGYERELAGLAERAAPALAVEVVAGGASRSRSVANALGAAPDASVVIVHDAARPLVSPELVDRCVAELERSGCDGAVAAARATDTIKEADVGGHVIATLERGNLWAVQTPQAFRAGALRDALATGAVDGAYDDAQLVESAGGDVRIVEAPRDNLKVTTSLDLRMAELLLAERGDRH